MKPIRTLLIILTLNVITSCGQGLDNNKSLEKIAVDTKALPSNEIINQQRHHFDTTFVVNKQTFKFVINDIEDEVTMTFIRNSKKIKTDTLQSVGLGGFEFTDFNKDGNLDILITYLGNNSSYDLYLFDNSINEFKDLEGFDRFPEAIQLKTNPNYYYSYHRAGCADMDWVSDLFYIDNFKTIQVGHIYGQGCDFEVKENPQVIAIYKVLANSEENKMLIKKLPYIKNIPKFGDKWNFIEKYWNNNYEKFN
ncbi:hypothetical protein [Flavobacterium undicola]|uniref:hypothetical protein n=1 Tax=Flavobacterium undicola TaxID=1932779 RepID=UPI001378D1DA|nr:hypothetical protein [Flavobacterium undicola]MBA0883120.1 hypothetical protein [Flavobacterium undicola]